MIVENSEFTHEMHRGIFSFRPQQRTMKKVERRGLSMGCKSIVAPSFEAPHSITIVFNLISLASIKARPASGWWSWSSVTLGKVQYVGKILRFHLSQLQHINKGTRKNGS